MGWKREPGLRIPAARPADRPSRDALQAPLSTLCRITTTQDTPAFWKGKGISRELTCIPGSGQSADLSGKDPTSRRGLIGDQRILSPK